MKLDLGGLVFGCIYLAVSVPLMVLAYSSPTHKGLFFYTQLATLPAGIFFTGFGLVDTVMEHPWINNIPMAFLLSLLLCYGIGWGLNSLAQLTRRQ